MCLSNNIDPTCLVPQTMNQVCETEKNINVYTHIHHDIFTLFDCIGSVLEANST